MTTEKAMATIAPYLPHYVGGSLLDEAVKFLFARQSEGVSDEKVQIALEAAGYRDDTPVFLTDVGMRAALIDVWHNLPAQEKAEPVAWLADDGTGRVIDVKAKSAGSRAAATGAATAVYSIPLYTAPPAERVRVPDEALAVRITDYLCEQEYDIGGRNDLLAHVRKAMLSTAPEASHD